MFRHLLYHHFFYLYEFYSDTEVSYVIYVHLSLLSNLIQYVVSIQAYETAS